MDLATFAALFSASVAFRSAKITAGVVSSVSSMRSSLSKSELEALFELSAPLLVADWFLLTVEGGGGGGAVGGLGGLDEALVGAGAGGMFPGCTVTRVAGLAYRFPLS